MPSPIVVRPLGRGVFIGSMTLALVAVASTFVVPERSSGMTALVWIAVLVPGFLLAYHRAVGDAAIAIAACMIALALLGAVESASAPDAALMDRSAWPIAVVALLLVALVELRYRELRRRGEFELMDRQAGLPNRAFFDLAIERAFGAAERGAPLSIVKFDLDNLAAVNKRFGLPAGDSAIRAFADALRRETRREDISVRYEGDTFVTILSRGDAAAADLFAQRVLERYRASAFQWGMQTASAGVAVYDRTMPAPSFLVDEARRAVHRAKAAGRNRVALPLTPDELAAIRRESLRTTTEGVTIADFAAQASGPHDTTGRAPAAGRGPAPDRMPPA